MKLKTSLFKRGLIISDLKRFWWVSALYTLALFFTIPFNHYIQKFNATNDQSLQWLKESITNELTFKGGSSPIFLLGVPIIIAVLVFRYMQKSRSASLYQSLPLTRAALYFNSVVSAIILFVSPLLCITFILFFLNWFSYLSAYYTTMLIFSWLLYSLLFGIMFMAMGIFVGMFTGSSIAQLAFVYILNLLPMFLVEFIKLNVKGLLFGFDTYSNVDFYDKMPMVMQFNVGYMDFPVTLIIIYIIVTIALLIGGLFAFKLRKPETAGDIISFRPIQPIFIYGVVTCATLLGGAYFMEIGHYSFTFAIFGYFISSIISYVVVQMITNKSFKVLHTYKGYIGFALVLVVLALGIKFDVIGYVNKIPNPSEVEETYIGYNLNWWENKDNPDFDINKYGNDETTVYKDPQNIEKVTKLHKLILDNKSNNGNSEYIAYKLKNGKRIIRRYTIDTDLYASALGPLYESSEYKEDRYPILHQEVNDLKYIEINDRRTGKNPFIVSDKAQLEGFKSAIRKDIANLSYQELVSDTERVIFINIIDTKDKHITYELRTSFKNTLAWLKSEGIYDQIILKPEYVSSVVLESFSYKNDSISSKAQLAESKRTEIIDKKIIQELLDLSLDTDYTNKATNYSVTFTSTNLQMYNFQMSFDDKVSPELQSYVDKIK